MAGHLTHFVIVGLEVASMFYMVQVGKKGIANKSYHQIKHIASSKYANESTWAYALIS